MEGRREGKARTLVIPAEEREACMVAEPAHDEPRLLAYLGDERGVRGVYPARELEVLPYE